MNTISTIYSEISEKDKLNFISSCFAKQKNLFGCPRLVITDKISKKSIEDVFLNQTKFTTMDSKYFPLIDNDFSFLESLNIKVIFDTCQKDFTNPDELSNYLSEDIKKFFNLNLRLNEQNNFIVSNSKHYMYQKTICEQVIFEKLNEIWKSKWTNPNSYINNINKFSINI